MFAVSTFISSAAGAETNGPNTVASLDTDFYAYVKAGENLDAVFTKTGGIPVGLDDTVITLSRPGTPDESCTIPVAALNGFACTFADRTAPTDGIWRLSLRPNEGHIFTWSINAQTGTTDIPGRVWTEQYTLTQITTPLGIDFTYWYQDKSGYLYQTTYRDYNGLLSVLGASSLGLVEPGGGCTPLYKSVNMTDTDFAIAPSNCQSYFKLFFEPPAADLPSSALKWDGASEWVKPPITPPVISNLNFTSATSGSRNGSLDFDVGSYTGLLFVDVDTNNNGVYTDPVDVTLQQIATSSSASVPFDGLDGNGIAIPNSQAISFRVRIDRQAEIHFLNQDVERRNGGIEVILLNGPTAGDDTLFWDDTRFANPDPNRCSVTPTSDGTGGISSTGGIHEWTNDAPCTNFGSANNGINGSWGDYRIINDWTYASSNVSATYQLASASTSPVASPIPSAPNTGIGLDRDFTPLVVFIGAILMSIGIIWAVRVRFLNIS
jgi:hypothetical protein